MSMDRRKKEQNVVHAHNGILCTVKKEGDSDTCLAWVNLEGIVLSEIS